MGIRTLRRGLTLSTVLLLLLAITPRAAAETHPLVLAPGDALLLASADPGPAGSTSGGPYPLPPPAQFPPSAFDQWKQFKKGLEDKVGFQFDLCIQLQDQVVLHGPGKGHDGNVFWWHLGMTQRLWPGAKLVVRTRGGAGHGVTNRVGGDTISTDWMANEPDPIYVSAVYLEQKLFDNRLTVCAGKMSIGDFMDASAVGDWEFLSYAFARNPQAPVPWHVLAALARYDLTDQIYVQAGVADAAGSPTEVGFNTAFHGDHSTLSIYEVGVKHPLPRPGMTRLTLWYDTRSVDRVDGVGSHRGDVGFAVGVDQEILDKTVAFFRYGHSNPALRQIEDFWSLGVRRTGLIPGRPNDVTSAAFAQEILGRDWRQAHGSATATQSLFEVYYAARITEWCSINPDLQVILNPGGSSASGPAVILGVNLQLNF